VIHRRFDRFGDLWGRPDYQFVGGICFVPSFVATSDAKNVFPTRRTNFIEAHPSFVDLVQSNAWILDVPADFAGRIHCRIRLGTVPRRSGCNPTRHAARESMDEEKPNQRNEKDWFRGLDWCYCMGRSDLTSWIDGP